MSASLRTGLSKDERSGSWFDELTTSGSTSSPRAVRRAHHERFDKLGIQPDPSRPRNDRGVMVTQLQGCRSAPRRLAVSGQSARWIRFVVSETSKEISKPGTRILSLSFTTGYN